ncbi:MAG: undecaprenyl-diphosphate phosphatase [Acidimicrobiales bacterium]|nr:undecaprenyl-diphosphate phosphatase [Acidimicrobiales bacterium]MDG1878393.1 undecaprenyl-diphosphate phosphatase [Acidimicrobiales bacterium]
MPILHAIVLGIVQGISEFLPISSSGHLELTRWAFGWNSLPEELETSFDVAVHMGTLVGAVAYLRRDVWLYLTAGLAPLHGGELGTDGRIAWFLVASAIPAGITGVVLKEQIGDLDRIWVIASMLIVFGLLLLVADRLPERRERAEFRLRDALAMGVGQALALQPGVSRSGATLTVSRFLGFERDVAARLVFLMSLPIIAGAGVFSLADASISSDFWPPFLWGMASSAVTGWVAVWGTLRLVRSHTFTPFVVYRVLLGIVVFAALAIG